MLTSLIPMIKQLKWSLCAVCLVLTLVQTFELSAQCKTELSEEQKIEKLILAVSSIDGKFIRNEKEHNATEAAEHLRLKLSNAQKSLFSSGKNWTAVQFIDQLATKSSLSGIPYEIHFKNGQKILSADWLKAELKKMEQNCPKS